MDNDALLGGPCGSLSARYTKENDSLAVPFNLESRDLSWLTACLVDTPRIDSGVPKALH